METKKNVKGMRPTVIAILILIGVAIWQFYLFVTFKGTNGFVDSQGGHVHLWFSVAAAVLACVAAFWLFSVFLKHRPEDELHITSPPLPKVSKHS